MGRLKLTGFLAWLLWSVAHIYFLIGFRNRLVVAMNWMWNYLTFQRGTRLITEIVGAQTRDVKPEAASKSNAREVAWRRSRRQRSKPRPPSCERCHRGEPSLLSGGNYATILSAGTWRAETALAGWG